jgi:cytochrome c oxidase subunit IV
MKQRPETETAMPGGAMSGSLMPGGLPGAATRQGTAPGAANPARLIRIWVALMALVGAQILLTAGGLSRPLLLALLLGLSVLEAEIVLFWFMHLRFERRALAFALVPVTIITMLLLVAIFPDSGRTRRLTARPAEVTTPAHPTP